MNGGMFGAVVGVIVGLVVGATVIGPRVIGQRTVTPERVDLPDRPGPLEPLSKGSVEPPVTVESVTRWRLSSAYPSSMPQIGNLAKRLENEIWKISAGDMEIRVQEPGSLVAPRDLLDAVSTGTIEAAFGSPGLWVERIAALQLFSAIPFGPRATEYLAWIYFGGGEKLMQELYARYDIHTMVCGVGAPRASGWFRNEIATLKDFDGLKMRIDGLGAKMLKRLGVEPVALDGGDIFLAFEKQEIDAAAFSMPSVDLKLGFNEFSGHYYFPGWQQPATIFNLLISSAAWRSLTPANQARIASICGDNVRYALADGEAAQFDALKELTAKGVTLHRWPDTVLDRLRQVWQDVAAEEAEADKDFAKVWSSIVEFRRSYAIWRELGYL